MEKYFLFLKKPFSFKGRFNKVQYLISLLITAIFSFISILIVALLFYELDVYQKTTSLVSAEKELKVIEDKLNHQIIYNANFKEIEKTKRDISTKTSIVMLEQMNYCDNKDYLVILFCIILNIPSALFLIASGTKRSHDIGDSGMLQIALPFYIWVLLFKNSEKSDNIYGAYILSDINTIDNPNKIETLVSEICPNCKNPNTHNLKICEWCGNQIV